MKGESIAEIAAFSATTGEWATQRLLKPIKEQIVSRVCQSCALFQEGNNFYAFSAEKGQWGVLSLPDGESLVPVSPRTGIMVQQGDQIFVFSVKWAKWSKGISAKPFKLNRKTAEPRQR